MALSSTYIPNVPQGTQQINNTQQSINTDFQDIYDLLAINHVPFNTSDTFGRHNFVSYVAQSSDPSTSSTEIALYSKVDSSGQISLFYRYPNSGSINSITQATSDPTPGTFTAYVASGIGGTMIFNLGGGIQVTILSVGAPTGATAGLSVTGTQTFNYLYSFPNIPFYISASICSLPLVGNVHGSVGLVGCSIIDATSFSLTFQSGYTSGSVYIMAMSIS